MNRLGMVVDISHVSDKTFWDSIEVTDKPIMASHSSAWSICQHPRNMKDDMLRAVATNGGVVNVNFYPAFVTEETRIATERLQEATWDEIEGVEKFARRSAIAHYSGTPEYVAQQRAEIQARRMASWSEVPQPTLSDVVDHIEHIAKVAGVDHVGLGSDFDGIPGGPVGLEDCSKFPAITEELLRREFTEADIRKILGENTMRVMEANIGQ